MAGTKRDKAVDILENRGIIAFSTDTVNGIGTLYDNMSGIDLIYKMKGRDEKKPFVLFFSSKEMLFKYFYKSAVINDFVNRYLPGGVTIIAKPRKNFYKKLLLDSMASFRIPAKHDLIELIRIIDKPLAVTSLNLSGKETITDKKTFDKHFGRIFIFNSLSKRKTSSTVVRIKSKKLEIIRQGIVNIEGLA